MRVALCSGVLSVLLVFGLIVGPGVAQTAGPDADRTVTSIAVEADGDAVWSVEVWTRLSSEREVSRFRSFQQSFRNDSSPYVDPFETRIRGVVDRAGNVTGREMAATNFTAATRVQEVPRRWGIVEYRFHWSNFARVNDTTLLIGDVFEGGYYLTASDTLRIEQPPEFERTTVEPTPDEATPLAVEWSGELDFADARPRVVLTGGESTTTSPGTDTATTPGTSTTDGSQAGAIDGLVVPLAVVLVLGLVLVGGYAVRSRTRGATDPAVRTDAEAVEALLRERGRTKQSEIARELDWTPSKTSRVLSNMEAEGTVTRTRIGRENVVDFDEE
jgi:hypothetical protein